MFKGKFVQQYKKYNVGDIVYTTYIFPNSYFPKGKKMHIIRIFQYTNGSAFFVLSPTKNENDLDIVYAHLGDFE